MKKNAKRWSSFSLQISEEGGRFEDSIEAVLNCCLMKKRLLIPDGWEETILNPQGGVVTSSKEGPS